MNTENDNLTSKLKENCKQYNFNLYHGYPEKGAVLCPNTEGEIREQELLAYYLLPDDSVLELGARTGSSSIIISKKLKNGEKHVSVEPNPDTNKILQVNKDLFNAKFFILGGIIARTGGDYWYYRKEERIVKYDTGMKCNTYCFDELNKTYNFTVLFADCEGSIQQIINEYPNIGNNLRLVIYERDMAKYCNYNFVDKYWKSKGFKTLYDNGFHVAMSK